LTLGNQSLASRKCLVPMTLKPLQNQFVLGADSPEDLPIKDKGLI
jgi:hypothetical protein